MRAKGEVEDEDEGSRQRTWISFGMDGTTGMSAGCMLFPRPAPSSIVLPRPRIDEPPASSAPCIREEIPPFGMLVGPLARLACANATAASAAASA